MNNFDEVRQKLLRYELIPDGDPIETEQGKIATFLGLDGETISINNIQVEEEVVAEEENIEDNVEKDEIKRILSKIKL